jgi:hypothetical protein
MRGNVCNVVRIGTLAFASLAGVIASTAIGPLQARVAEQESASGYSSYYGGLTFPDPPRSSYGHDSELTFR